MQVATLRSQHTWQRVEDGNIGHVEEFEGNRDWQQYMECLEHFFVANSIDGAEKKRAVFLSIISLTMYKTLQNLPSPDKPGD